MMNKVSFLLNGAFITLQVHPLKRLVDVLRDDLDLTGSKEGCGEGECGACAVLVNDRLVNACLIPIGTLEGKSVVTIEGYKNTDKFQVLKNAFEQAGSVQCGFCTPGMILAAEALLIQNPHPTSMDVRQAMAGNLCRCTGYTMIVEAVLQAAREGDGLW